jgi:hypothetical protein
MVVTSPRIPSRAAAPPDWSLGAFVFAAVGLGCSVLVIFGSDSDPSHVWPLVVAPIGITLVPLLVPRQGARIGALVALGFWCFLTGFSIGMLLLPALFATLMAAARDL